jgi:hypothetical protein
MHPPTMNTIFILWNKEFNYYKEQPLDSTMVKHKLKGGSFFATKHMKFKTKNMTMKIQFVLLNQIHFLACMYIIMWATMKEEHT